MKKIVVILVILLLLVLFMAYHTEKDYLILDGYFDSDEYWDKNAFQDYTDYCKYYYKDSGDLLFQNNPDYQEVKEEDIENIISYFNDFEQWMKTQDRLDEYDFDTHSITVGDYIHIKTKEGTKIGNGVYDKFDNYSIYLYDTDSHTLIYIHNNI